VLPGKTGWLVKPDDAEDLAAVLEEALAMNKKQLKILGEHGRRHVTDNFSSQAMCEKTLAYYYDLLGQK
jgi:glycosyltransferase involved in cell wall biosynthesis